MSLLISPLKIKNKRKKDLDLFNKIGFPNKKDEDWKFTDLNSILSKNFTNIVNKEFPNEEKKPNFIGEFQHNYISLFNGKLVSNNFSYEEEDKILLKEFLKKIKVNLIKIASGEITNIPLLKKIGKSKKKVIMSTGMSNLKEIKKALNILIKNGTKKKET